MTLTEELVLVLLNPATGRAVVDSTSLDRAIGGALLLDLATRERITADGDGARARLSVVDAAPTGDALLDAALAKLDKPLKAHKVVDGPRRQLRARAAEVAEGEWAGQAVRKGVQAVQSSLAAAIAVSAAAGSSGSS